MSHVLKTAGGAVFQAEKHYGRPIWDKLTPGVDTPLYKHQC